MCLDAVLELLNSGPRKRPHPHESSNNVEKCRIWSNEIGCTVCQKLVEYKCSEMKDPNEKLGEVVFDC